MAANLEKLAKEYKIRGYPEFANSLEAQAVIARKLGIPENFYTIETEKPKVQRFTREQKDALKKDGFMVYKLTGQSINTLGEADNSFSTSVVYNCLGIKDLISRTSEVAVLKGFYLPGSSNKTFLEQESLVNNFSKEISTKIQGVEAIIGEVSDYAQLIYLSPMTNPLFGKDYEYGYTITQTPFVPPVDSVVGPGVAIIGRSVLKFGLEVTTSSLNNRHEYLFVAPLIVPKAAK